MASSGVGVTNTGIPRFVLRLRRELAPILAFSASRRLAPPRAFAVAACKHVRVVRGQLHLFCRYLEQAWSCLRVCPEEQVDLQASGVLARRVEHLVSRRRETDNSALACRTSTRAGCRPEGWVLWHSLASVRRVGNGAAHMHTPLPRGGKNARARHACARIHAQCLNSSTSASWVCIRCISNSANLRLRVYCPLL